MKSNIKPMTNLESVKETNSGSQKLNRQSDRRNYYIGIDLGTTNSVCGMGYS